MGNNTMEFGLKRHTLENFIPQVWSAQLLVSLKKSLVYGQEGIINRSYEGEITAFGDTVNIHNIGEVSIGDYTKNADMTAPETLDDGRRSLTIDQAKYFNFQIDDVDMAQQRPKVMQQAMVESAYALRNTADQHIAAMYTGVDAENLIGDDTAPEVISGKDAYDALVELSVKLDEQNVPEENRFVIIPPWYHGQLLLDDRFVKAGVDRSFDTLMNGQVGMAAGFNVLKSNNVPNTAGAAYKVIAGYSGAWSFAEQINDVEAYRPEKRFADAVKGLHLYGSKLVRPYGLAVLTADKA